MGFGVGCATHKSKIAYNFEYLARTVKCLDSISINQDLLYFASNNPSNALFLWTEVWQVFLLVYLPEGHKFPKKKCRQDNELDLVREFPCICRLYLHSFPFLISKPNYSFFFEGAHFDFQAESIRMRDNC